MILSLKISYKRSSENNKKLKEAKNNQYVSRTVCLQASLRFRGGRAAAKETLGWTLRCETPSSQPASNEIIKILTRNQLSITRESVIKMYQNFFFRGYWQYDTSGRCKKDFSKKLKTTTLKQNWIMEEWKNYSWFEYGEWEWEDQYLKGKWG